jgi:hypothetical protein
MPISTKELYDRYAVDGSSVDAWLDYAGVDYDGPIAEMRGTFHHSNKPFFYNFEFQPITSGKDKAIVIPLFDGDELIDIFAASKANDDLWGCVTGQARFLNQNVIKQKRTAPLHVCRYWWQWLALGCEGVLPLSYDQTALLEAGDIVVDNRSHALSLLHDVFIWPAEKAARIAGTSVDSAGRKARRQGESRIFVDQSDDELIPRLSYEVATAVAKRAA